ncbi:MAG TPA: alpha-glucan family phosphorylase, partial [Planctomycetota bacterium]|nr:alpha-glucan family phosphorylase [Planctomycetota bacterium]
MRNVRTYTVVPALPERLSALRDIAFNLWWTWTKEARQIFIDVGRDTWESSGHNPVLMLGRISPARLKQLSEDNGFLAMLDRVKKDLDDYMSTTAWHGQTHILKRKEFIAYFSAEFGLHECLPIYSGGLGLLAGDHLKAASGLGLPLVGVGLFYYNGYFRQYLNPDGFQQEFLSPNDFYNLPCTLETEPNSSKPLMIAVDFPGRKVWAQIWKVQVGRIPLYLLDTRVDANSSDDRTITDQLYGGDHEHRIKQEILLGVGGVRALRALGREPEVVHMNEGHAAFSALERMRIAIE